MTLTEQWKKGELPDGMYYMENTSGIIGMVGHSKVFPCYNVKQILASVPSYEEWQQLRKWCEEFNALDVAKENQQLKTLLKEWMHFYPIILYEHEDTLKTKDIVELYEKTREVLK